MKTILRIFIILAVAAAIGGLMFLLISRDSASVAGPGLEGPDDRLFAGREEFSAGNLPAGFSSGMRHGHGEGLDGGVFSWAETIRNGIVVAVRVALVAWIERMFKPRRARKVAPVGVSPADGKGNDPSA